MFAETVSIDGEVVALFLVVILAVVAAWLAFGYIGYRLIRRGNSLAAFVAIGVIAIADAWLLWFAVVGDAGLVTLPVGAHAIAAVQRMRDISND